MKRISSKDLIRSRQQEYDVNREIRNTVEQIVNDVRRFGDKSLLNYSQWLENNDKKEILIEKDRLREIAGKIDIISKEAIDLAWANIYKFHERQYPGGYELETSAGVVCSLKYNALKRVGIYIPGGTAPLFSSLLMLGVPAKIADVEEIVICTPFNKDYELIPEIAYIAAEKIGVRRIYRVGGAQAIAAMAFGTETIPKVDKIFGPGNQYVTYAKQYISVVSRTAIDMPAGPSEVLVVADETSDENFVAQDILAQAEHGKDSLTVLLSSSVSMIERVESILQDELKTHPRKDILQESLKNCTFVSVDTIEDAITLSNEFGPEHLILSIDCANDYKDLVSNAGSVFLGKYSAESFGDYASGTNHTLPTSGFCRAYSGVKTGDFMKSISYQEIKREGLLSLGTTVMTMAKREGLYSHAKSVELRLRKEND